MRATDNGGVHTPHQNIDALVPGNGPTNLGKAEDAAHVSGDTGVMALAVQRNSGGSTAADGDYVPITTDSSGRVHTNVGSATFAKSADSTPGATDAGVPAYGVRDDVLAAITPADGDYAPHRLTKYGAQHVSPVPQEANGLATARIKAAASTNATSVKATAGKLHSIFLQSTVTAGAWRYLKLYNKASAPTVGTDVPVLTIPVSYGVPVNISFGDIGISFSTGIAYAITTGADDTDTGAVAANELIGALGYF